jgi:hypothetical protein
MRQHLTVNFCSAAALLSAIIGTAGSPAFAAQDAVEVAFVADVTGHVVAFSQGKPALVAPLATINHRTQLDLPANSEVRVCHYQAGKIVSLKGPLRVTVSRDGVTAGNGGRIALAAAGPCAAPVASTSQGGIVTRGVSDRSAAKNAPKPAP